MKKIITTLIVSVLLPFHSFALDYSISFNATGASSTLDSVIVQNLTRGTVAKILAGSILQLSDVITDKYQNSIVNPQVSIFSYSSGKIGLRYISNETGDTKIQIFDINGTSRAQFIRNIYQGENTFVLNLPKGTFLLRIQSKEFVYSTKVVSTTQSYTLPNIQYSGVRTIKSTTLRNAPLITSMLYFEGDRLLFKGISGNYANVVVDTPSSSKTINFELTDCTDGDGNHYATVKIGNQTWMVENLRTTSYRSGESIQNMTDYTSWFNSNKRSTGGYSAHNSVSQNEIFRYGLLYNWYAATNVSNIAPTGWHVPSTSEWDQIESYLVLNGFNFDNTTSDNKIGKSMALSTIWNSSLTTGNIGYSMFENNKSGFSAIPGGYKSYNSIYYGFGESAYFWTSTSMYSWSAWGRALNNNSNFLGQNNGFDRRDGYSIRCIKD